jgi:hypothetical protein
MRKTLISVVCLSHKPARKKAGKPAPVAVAPPAASQPTHAATADVFTHIEAIKEAVRQLDADQVRRIVGLFEDR